MKAKSLTIVITSFLVSVFLGLSLLKAQSPAGSLSGEVRDSSGAVIPDVILEALHTGNGHVDVAYTDGEGRYEFLRLLPGTYELSTSLQGFNTVRHKELYLNAGQAITLDLVLQVQDAQQSITVIGEAAPLDVSSPHSSYVVNDISLAALPINGRTLDSLALLAPGMIPIRAKDRRSLNGLTQEISGNGARGTGYQLDGTDIQHPILKTTPGGVSGLLLGMDSVQEFEVLNDAYPAYIGGSGGATVNVVTRRGTRDVHGSAFWFYRDSSLDARNFFDRDPDNYAVRSNPPEFSRHQYGGSIGGPLPGEENTFFLTYEGLRERLGLTLYNTVPNISTRSGDLPTGSVTVSDAVVPILNLYPLPNGRDFGDGSATYIFQQEQPTDDQHFNVRTDFRLGPSDSLFVRYTLHDSKKLAPYEVSIAGFDSDLASLNQYLTIEETHLFSSRLLHTAQFSYNRGAYTGKSVASTAELAKAPKLIPGRPNMGRINLRGLTAFGTDTADVNFPFGQYQVSDTFQFSSGSHDLRWGFAWKNYRSDGSYNFFFDGLLVYENLRDFLRNKPRRFIGARKGSNAHRQYRQNLLALFFHDQYRLSSELTLSYGVRYEWFSVPTEAQGRISNLRQLTDSAPTVGDPLFKNPSHLNFAPRVGLAWNIGGKDQTVLRSGYGIFYEPILENIFGYRVRIQTPFTEVRTVINPSYPNPLGGGGRSGKPRQDALEFELSTPYLMRYHLTLQQALGYDLVLRLGYHGSRGVHLTRVGDINIPAPVSTGSDGRPFFGLSSFRPRPNRGLDAVRLTSTDANSVYSSLQIGLTRRWESGFQFQFNYTYGRSIDDASAYRREFTNSMVESPYYFNRTGDRGLSNFHIAHTAVLQYTWNLPFSYPRRSVVGFLLNDWQTSGILTFSGGYPFTANVSFDIARTRVREGDRPDLVPGASNNPVLGGPDRYFDVSAFKLQPTGYLGTLGRNTLVGPGLATLDIGFLRLIDFGDSNRFEFRLDVFNLLNRANFSHPQNRGGGGGVIVFNSPNGVPVGNASSIFSTTSSSRQLQLGVRYIF
ncbi:MAG: TonB-dependent receptor [Acidobacteriota bacterium]|nr:TonB-dependent receptor [Acidobacteriota bacterium]